MPRPELTLQLADSGVLASEFDTELSIIESVVNFLFEWSQNTEGKEFAQNCEGMYSFQLVLSQDRVNTVMDPHRIPQKTE